MNSTPSVTHGFLSLLFCVAVIATSSCLAAQVPTPQPNLLTTIHGKKDPLAGTASFLRSRPVAVDVQLLDTLTVGCVVRVELFADTVFSARFANREDYDKGHYVWTGSLDGLPSSSFIISVCQGKVDASFAPVDSRWQNPLTIQTASGVHVVREIDQRMAKSKVIDAAAGGTASPMNACDDPLNEITILVVYDNTALAEAGGTNGIKAAISTRMTELNSVMTNSIVDLKFKLATTPIHVQYSTAGLDVDVKRLRYPLGYLDQVRTWRNTYRADLVAILVGNGPHGGYAGQAYATRSLPMNPEDAFSASLWYSPLTFAHEVCHNLGCRHDPANSSGTRVYPYAYGHKFGSPLFGFSTLMAYNDIWYPTRIAMLSSPHISYGIWVPGTPTADNRQVVFRVRQAVANFRMSNTSPTITTHPSSVSRCLGYQTNAAIMKVAVSSAPNYPTSYSWYRNGTRLNGQNSNTLTLTNLKSSSAGVYRCEVSNLCGSYSSNPATLTVTGSCNLRRWTGRVNGYGSSVSRAGDVNRDGYEDIIVGDQGDSAMGTTSGSMVVISGKDSTTLMSKSYAAGEQLGYSVAAAGDVDQDGYGDVIVGAPGYKSSQGYARVLSGRTQAELWFLTGAPTNNAFFGVSVCGAGDTDGDGHPDLLVGASGIDQAYLFSGKTGLLIRTMGWATGDKYGRAVAAAGDIDRDGYADVIVGAPGYNSSIGFAQVFSGKTGLVIHSVFGSHAAGQFGFSLAGIGDVNRDGVPDFAVGAPMAAVGGTYSGEVRVFSGADKSVLFSTSRGSDESFGYSIAAAGDTDGDLVPDIHVGAPRWGGSKGYARTISGKDGSTIATHLGLSPNGQLGASVSGVEANGDAYPDLVAGAPGRGIVWLYDAALEQDPPAIEVFGAACQGSNGKLPHLEFGGRASVGQTFSAEVYAGAPAVTTLFMIDAVRSHVSLAFLGAPNCVVSALPTLSSQLTTDAGGEAGVNVTIPNQASLIGTQAYTQWLLLDMPANVGGFVTSNAARIQFGHR